MLKSLCKTPLDFKLTIKHDFKIRGKFDYEFKDFPPLKHYILGYDSRSLNFLEFKGFKDWLGGLKRSGEISSKLQIYGKSGKYYTPLWDNSYYYRRDITYDPSINHYTITFSCSNKLPKKRRDGVKDEVLVRLITSKKFSTYNLLRKMGYSEFIEYEEFNKYR